MGTLGANGNRRRPTPHVLRIGAAWALVTIFSGCARPELEPYVFRASEFERKNIGRPASIPGLIQVCYSGSATTSDAVIRVAEAECAKFGKTAQMFRQDISECPLTMPVTATYLCCPTEIPPSQRYRCSATGGQVERLNNDQVRELLAAERRRALISIENDRIIQKSKERTP
jgi:hypothetical protein